MECLYISCFKEQKSVFCMQVYQLDHGATSAVSAQWHVCMIRSDKYLINLLLWSNTKKGDWVVYLVDVSTYDGWLYFEIILINVGTTRIVHVQFPS